MVRFAPACLLLGLLAAPAHAADALPAASAPTQAVAPVSSKRPSPKKKKGDRAAKRAADKKAKKNYGTGQTIAATGVVAGATGLVVLGFGLTSNNGFTAPSQGNLNLAGGLLSIGGLVGSSGAMGAGIAVDGVTKKPTPVVAGALGLTLGIFAPTFWGVGTGLQMPAFSYAAIGTGAASTLLTAIQMRQSDASRPKRWMRGRIDPVNRRFVLTGTF